MRAIKTMTYHLERAVVKSPLMPRIMSKDIVPIARARLTEIAAAVSKSGQEKGVYPER